MIDRSTFNKAIRLFYETTIELKNIEFYRFFLSKSNRRIRSKFSNFAFIEKILSDRSNESKASFKNRFVDIYQNFIDFNI